MSRFNEKEFIEKFDKHTGGKYKYLGYENRKVKFYCPKHNCVDYDTPHHLLKNRGCKLCGREKRQQYNKECNEKARATFVEKARKIHGDKYDYSEVNYIKNNIKVSIICPKHGKFDITPNSHLNGSGCKQCGIEACHNQQRKTLQQFLKEAKEVHGDKYDYSRVKYVSWRSKVEIICPDHGLFTQSAGKHTGGQGCPLCKSKENAEKQKMSTEEFIAKSQKIHGNKYDYSKTHYENYDTPLCIICPTHGEFWQTPDSHLQGSGCQKCSHRLSKNENEIADFMETLLGKKEVKRSVNTILPHHLEIDILIPRLHIGIEYNGCRWHTEEFGKGQYFHLTKTEECKKQGLALIHIFEDEYINKKDIVLAKLTHLCHCNHLPQIGARKCKIKEISYQESKNFLDKNHIQGGQKASVYLGAEYNNEIVAVMTFIKTANDEWELNRFATDIRYRCSGIGGKLFTFFIRNYDPSTIKSFADRRWTIDEENNLYTKLGFSLEEVLKPDYRYVISGSYERIHKFNFRKRTLHKKYGFDLSMTESQMAEKLKAYKVWDCGLLRYVWRKTTPKILK